MSTDPVTIAAVAGLDADVKGAFLDSREREAAKQVGSDALVGLARAAPGAALDAILGALATELATPLADILREGWKQDAQLRAEIAGGPKGPATRGEVALHKHTISATLEPTAEVLVNGVPGPKLHFEVKLSVLFEGLLLVIKDATITALKAGNITAKLELSYVTGSGPTAVRLPMMHPRARKFAAETEFPLPRGGIKIV